MYKYAICQVKKKEGRYQKLKSKIMYSYTYKFCNIFKIIVQLHALNTIVENARTMQE